LHYNKRENSIKESLVQRTFQHTHPKNQKSESDDLPQTLLITGGSGMLGANLAYMMSLDSNDNIHLQYNTHKIEIPGVVSSQADLKERSQLERLLEEVSPRVIIHCAALTNLDYIEMHPSEALQVNAGITRDLAVISGRLGIKLVFISTDSLFGEVRDKPFHEEEKISPKSIYSYTKALGEQAVLSACPGSLVIRTCIIGVNAVHKLSLAEWVVQELSLGKHINGFRNIWFTPILCNDLANALTVALDNQLGGVYHIAGADSITKYEFACKLARIFEYDEGLIESADLLETRDQAPRPRTPRLDCHLFANHTSYVLPVVDETINRFHSLYKNGYRDMLKSFV
jgi:dTDP-4-dehydrorhamnose reductase